MWRKICGSLVLLILLTSPIQAHSIKVAPAGRYFLKDDKAFLVIGANDAITWPGLSPLLTQTSPRAARDYLAKLSSKGINTLRIMMEYAQGPLGLLENPLGYYRPEVVEFWDRLIEMAEEYGIYLILTPWDPFWMKPNWDANPYNMANGGVVSSMHGFLTDPGAILAQKERFHFLVKRYGGSPNILAWELMNEIELWWGAGAHEIEDWITMMAIFVREKQQEYHGVTPLITVSTAAPNPSGSLAKVIYNHPQLDFASTHLYTGRGMNAPFNTTDVAEEVGLAVNYSLFRIEDNRPYTDSENGPIEMWIASADFDAEYLHNVSWAHLASGGAGTGMRWPYRTPHILTDEMMDVLGRVGMFSAAWDFTGFSPENISADLVAPLDHQVYGIGDDNQSMIWILRDSRAQGDSQSAKITFAYLTPGEYQISFWDTWNSQWISIYRDRFVDWQGEIVTPEFEKDVLMVMRRIEDSAVK